MNVHLLQTHKVQSTYEFPDDINLIMRWHTFSLFIGSSFCSSMCGAFAFMSTNWRELKLNLITHSPWTNEKQKNK